MCYGIWLTFSPTCSWELYVWLFQHVWKHWLSFHWKKFYSLCWSTIFWQISNWIGLHSNARLHFSTNDMFFRSFDFKWMKRSHHNEPKGTLIIIIDKICILLSDSAWAIVLNILTFSTRSRQFFSHFLTHGFGAIASLIHCEFFPAEDTTDR